MNVSSGRSGGRLALGEKIGIGIDFRPCTVHIAFCQNSQNGIHTTIFGSNERVFGCDGLGNEFCNADFLHVCMVAEGRLDVCHVRAATRQNDTTQQPVGILAWNLIPDVLHDFLHTSFHDFHEFAAFDGAVAVDAEIE